MAKALSHLASIDQQTQALAKSIEASIADLAGQIAPLNERYRRITGEDFVRIELSGNPKGARGKARAASTPVAAKSAGKSKRIRRSGEQLKEIARNILAFVKKAGAEGVKGSVIKAEFGPLLPSVKEFVKIHGGKTLKTKGSKAAMTYHHSD